MRKLACAFQERFIPQSASVCVKPAFRSGRRGVNVDAATVPRQEADVRKTAEAGLARPTSRPFKHKATETKCMLVSPFHPVEEREQQLTADFVPGEVFFVLSRELAGREQIAQWQ